MSKQKLVIIGEGEFAEIAYEYLTNDSNYEVCAFSAEREFVKKNELNGLPVIAFEDLEQKYPPSEYQVYIAITYTQLNRIRSRLYKAVKHKGYKCASYISSKAFVWKNAKIGENCFIFENNVVQPFVTIEDNVVLWSGNHLGHRSIVRENCYISSHVVISGYCEIGENSFLGVNATLADNIKIAKDNFIAAGAVVLKNTEEGKIYQGNPAEAAKVGSLRFMKVKEE